jgi:hypothetical protein
MMKRRYIACVVSEEDVFTRWQDAAYIVARGIAREMRAHHLEDWPVLVHSEQINMGAWKLVFAWPERMEYV